VLISGAWFAQESVLSFMREATKPAQTQF